MSNYPSVTEILNRYTDFSMISAETVTAAADRGTLIHGVCCTIALGVPWMHEIPEGFEGYIQSFRRWFDLHVEEVLLAEKRLTHPAYLYTGKIDLIIKMKTEGVVLVDIKTPVALKKIWRWQIAGYCELAISNKFKIKKGGSLRLSPDGKPANMAWSKDYQADFLLFLSCLNIHRELAHG